jgi:hypothetical protein
MLILSGVHSIKFNSVRSLFDSNILLIVSPISSQVDILLSDENISIFSCIYWYISEIVYCLSLIVSQTIWFNSSNQFNFILFIIRLSSIFSAINDVYIGVVHSLFLIEKYQLIFILSPDILSLMILKKESSLIHSNSLFMVVC